MTMATKKSRRNGMKTVQKKNRLTNVKDDRHYKLPGFAAFNPHNVPIKKIRKGKLVPCEDIIEPESGIHSRAWAAAIVPQNTGFLKLPFEVRLKIYEYAIEDFSCGKDPIAPRKKGVKFWSPGWANIADETTKFYQLSRQVYVDFVGSSLLYKYKPFYFDSPTLLLNYLCVINPLHKNAIRSITLNINFRLTCTTLPTKAFNFLSKCKGLEELNIDIHLMQDMCRYSMIFYREGGSRIARSTVELLDPKVLQRIRDCEALENIKSLKRFDLEFVLPQSIGPSFNRHFVNHVFVMPKMVPSESTVAFYGEMRAKMEKKKKK